MDNQRYVCVECGASHDAFDVVPADLGVACPSCGGGCDPAEYTCSGCGKDLIAAYSWMWIAEWEQWDPACKECSDAALKDADKTMCPKCGKIVDRLMLAGNGCSVCMIDEIDGLIRAINKSLMAANGKRQGEG